jgi:hypothetical protein
MKEDCQKVKITQKKTITETGYNVQHVLREWKISLFYNIEFNYSNKILFVTKCYVLLINYTVIHFVL